MILIMLKKHMGRIRRMCMDLAILLFIQMLLTLFQITKNRMLPAKIGKRALKLAF